MVPKGDTPISRIQFMLENIPLSLENHTIKYSHSAHQRSNWFEKLMEAWYQLYLLAFLMWSYNHKRV